MAQVDGYARLHQLPRKVRADMLETACGYPDDVLIKELAFALPAVDMNEPRSMEWAACLLVERANRISREG